MALARQLAQYDYEQRRKQHQSTLRQQHIRNGQILHALEQNLAVIDAKARELRSKGIHDKELDVLLTQARWKRDQARAAALAGVEHSRALDDACHADQHQQPPPLLPSTTTSMFIHLFQQSFRTHSSPSTIPELVIESPAHVEVEPEPVSAPEPSPEPQQHHDSVIFSTSPEPFAPAAATQDITNEPQPAASTLRSLLRAGLSRLPTPRLTPVDSHHLSSPHPASNPLPTVAPSARRLSVPLASPCPIIIHTSPAQPSAPAPVRQPHHRRRNERLAVICQRDCWKVRHHMTIQS
jgi:hypothetical protein